MKDCSNIYSCTNNYKTWVPHWFPQHRAPQNPSYSQRETEEWIPAKAQHPNMPYRCFPQINFSAAEKLITKSCPSHRVPRGTTASYYLPTSKLFINSCWLFVTTNEQPLLSPSSRKPKYKPQD